MAKIYHFWMGVPYGTLTILCIMNKILEVFETSGKEVFTSKNKRNILKQDSKPWYTNKCYEYRKKNHRARKTYNLHKNEQNRLQMIQCSKSINK